ncbi:MAG: hypothetical protein AAB424_00510 [Patescibacteria group bacterium]
MLVFHEQPHEKVRVFVDFNGPKVTPKAFEWAGKRYDIHSVNLVYQRRRAHAPGAGAGQGKGYDWCFAVSDAANTYVLSYSPETLEWILEEVQGQ